MVSMTDSLCLRNRMLLISNIGLRHARRRLWYRGDPISGYVRECDLSQLGSVVDHSNPVPWNGKESDQGIGSGP